MQRNRDEVASAPNAPSRVDALEGLRGYLALWVLVCHVFWATGIEADALSGLPRLLRQGEYAVDLFIVVSGFVIFLALDTDRGGYRSFIVRRCFRLFPLFLVLFAVAIPLADLGQWNVSHATQYLTPDQIQSRTATMASWWENIRWHVPLHLLMLHGTVPDLLLEDAPGAFLIPAWSVSLEWQFYLVAPLAYALAVSSKRSWRLALYAICVGLFLGAHYALPAVRYGAALPFHVPFFFLGAASYFLYKRRSTLRPPDLCFPVACCICVFLLFRQSDPWVLLPVGLWILFLGLLLEPARAWSARILSPLFIHPLVRYLGRISYSVYLSHMLVIILVQHVLLVAAPTLTGSMHFAVLLGATFAFTLVASAVLYRFVEAPGIRLGRALVDVLKRSRVAVAREQKTLAAHPPAIEVR